MTIRMNEAWALVYRLKTRVNATGMLEAVVAGNTLRHDVQEAQVMLADLLAEVSRHSTTGVKPGDIVLHGPGWTAEPSEYRREAVAPADYRRQTPDE